MVRICALYVSLRALTLLVGSQKEHRACKNHIALIPKQVENEKKDPRGN